MAMDVEWRRGLPVSVASRGRKAWDQIGDEKKRRKKCGVDQKVPPSLTMWLCGCVGWSEVGG